MTSSNPTPGPDPMKPSPRVWDAPYAHGRRRHRHRCRCCHRIMNAGEPAVWCRLGRRTYVLHADCAEAAVMPNHPRHTWRDQFAAWAARHDRMLHDDH